jgi:hypothetical protein
MNTPHPRNVLGLLVVVLFGVVANRSRRLKDMRAYMQQMLHYIEYFAICNTTSRPKWL